MNSSSYRETHATRTHNFLEIVHKKCQGTARGGKGRVCGEKGVKIQKSKCPANIDNPLILYYVTYLRTGESRAELGHITTATFIAGMLL